MLSFTFIDRLFTRLLRISRMNRGSLGSSVWAINLALRTLIIWATRVFTSQVCIVSGHGQVFNPFYKTWMNLSWEPLIKAGACGYQSLHWIPRIAPTLGGRQAENFYVTIPPKTRLTNYSYPAKGVYLSFESCPNRKLVVVVKPPVRG